MSKVQVGFHVVVGQYFKEHRGSLIADGRPTVRVNKTKPTLERHEIAVFVNLELPASLFFRPALTASIKVGGDQASAVITPDVMSNIAAAVRDQLGIVMDVRAAESSS